MSKGANFNNIINLIDKKDDGHKVNDSISFDRSGPPLVLCPELGDWTTAQWTSNGLKCLHCDKHI